MACETRGGEGRKLLIDDEGEARIASDAELAVWARSFSSGSAAPFVAALDCGYVHIWLYGRVAFVLLRPDRVSPLTAAGAMDEIARLDQDWTIICSMDDPGGRVEWYRGSVPAIRRLGAFAKATVEREPGAQRGRIEGDKPTNDRQA